jgi:sulfur-carrier protein
MTMKVNVLIFGPLKDITRTHVCEVNDVMDTNGMINKLNSMYPGLDKMKYLVAVEKEIVQGNTALGDNFTVALLPPYSGG